jgi:tetrahydromethanopterin S-methyltransferase subunit G
MATNIFEKWELTRQEEILCEERTFSEDGNFYFTFEFEGSIIYIITDQEELRFRSEKINQLITKYMSHKKQTAEDQIYKAGRMLGILQGMIIGMISSIITGIIIYNIII